MGAGMGAGSPVTGSEGSGLLLTAAFGCLGPLRESRPPASAVLALDSFFF